MSLINLLYFVCEALWLGCFANCFLHGTMAQLILCATWYSVLAVQFALVNRPVYDSDYDDSELEMNFMMPIWCHMMPKDSDDNPDNIYL